MYILGIESSCDETAVAVIERTPAKPGVADPAKPGEVPGVNRVLDEQVKSQIPIHAIYGGVVPEIASRNHYEVIDHLTQEALLKGGLTIRDIDLIALTQGPGLIGSLLVGLSFAKGLAYANNIPLVGVDHISAHIESAFIDNPGIEYPLVALVVSGGHTTIFFQESKFKTEIIAKTRDDAVGEVLDKTAKFFGLGYPGGPIIDKIVAKGDGDKKRFKFTRPKMSDGSNDFSFSGYKTAVIRHPEAKNIQPDQQIFKDLMTSFLYSVVNYLQLKTRMAVEERNVKSLIVSGGVSRNTLLRETFQNEFDAPDSGTKLYMPSPQYCTDNASMVAWLGYEKYTAFPEENYFDPYLNAYSRATFKSKGKHR
ncbi:MAG: tRNA (adenosine(37)-N6)-threonylcarbamoyltransferase complex transferase subunit TsaD [bacterium]|nr:tRNA (adenosine(37)-N6)-threonylcarbamoyltransferase complex transferase subunit TsaD [bacterium]